MKRRCGALLLVLSVLTGSLYAQGTFYVDDDAPGDFLPRNPIYGDPNEDGSAQHPFDDIQEAIDVAVDGDTIIVAPGRYLSLDTWAYAELLFKGKSIHLVSSAPTDFSVTEQTILCGVVIFRGDEGTRCLLQGFKIQNYDCGGILGNNTLATISHCIITGNGPCGATVVKDCHGLITNCLIVDNITAHNCGILAVMSGCYFINNCTIANNGSGVDPRGGQASDTPLIRNCIIYGNQGPQIIPTPSAVANRDTELQIEHCLIEGWSTLGINRSSYKAILDADPCFVQPGAWLSSSKSTPTISLIEGDYHLKSEGWRWSEHEMHGSHWWFDLSTSPAIDAGDPMDSLGEELERVREDPEGQWGVNHAIDMGAYGGTAQASLAPTEGAAPGIGAVDLLDYWPLAVDNGWGVTSATGEWYHFEVEDQVDAMRYQGLDIYKLLIHGNTTTGTAWFTSSTTGYCIITGSSVYITGDFNTADVNALDLALRESVKRQYPRFLVIDSTVHVPEDPFTTGTVYSRPVKVLRGTLEEVHAGAAFDSTLFVPYPLPDEGPWSYGETDNMGDSWPDVIAFRPQYVDGTLGAPIAIFARGFGPLMLDSRFVSQGKVDETLFGSSGTKRR
jgi:hypothetical protein